MKPFFSIITPSFNQAAYLPACLDSIRLQGENDYEHLILDNCSSDGTEKFLTAYAADPRVRLFIEPDRGQSAAVNKGFRLAQGEIICWLNSDDAYFPETLTQVRHAFENPNVQVLFGDVRQISYEGSAPERAVARFEHRHDFIRWWSGRIRLHQPAVFFRRAVIEKIGLLNEQLHYAMDYEYWWRMSEHYSFHYLAKELAIQHRQPDSKTMRAWHHVLAEREKIFSSFYALLGEKKTTLRRERSQALAAHFLIQAYAAVKKDRRVAWFYFQQAWCHAPTLIFQPASFGLIRQLCFS